MSSQNISFIKRIGQSAKVQFQMLHLAVLPLELQFLKKIDHTTIYFFQKGHQILNSKSGLPLKVEANDAGAKHQLSQQQNTINFRIHSQKSLLYKWSVYKQSATGQHQYLQSCAFNLKQIVTNIILPLRSESIKSYQSMISYSFNEKLFRCRFQVTGIMVKFLLIVSNDPKKIKQVIRKHCSSKNIHKLYSLPTIEFTSSARSSPQQIGKIIQINNRGETVDHHDQFFLETYSFLSEEPVEKSNDNKGSDSLKKEEKSLSLGPKSKFQEQISKEIGFLKSKNISEEHLKSQNLKSQNMKSQNIKSQNMNSQNLKSQNIKSLDLDQIILNEFEKKPNSMSSQAISDNSDLKFGVEEHKQKSSNNYNIEINPNMLGIPKKGNDNKRRDYSILKLQSDSVKQQPQDVRLQNEEYANLQMIEEQRTSIKHQDIISSFKNSSSNSKKSDAFNKIKIQKKIQKPKEEIIQKQNIFYQNLKMKNVLIFLLLLSIVIIIGASALDAKQKQKGIKKVNKQK